MARRPVLSAILLIVAGALTVTSSFLTIAESTHRLLAPNSQFGDHPGTKVNITTTTAWSTTFSVPGQHVGQPLDGWGLVGASAVALAAAVLLLAGRGRWSWTKPLAALASGLLAGVILMSLLRFNELVSWDFEDKSQSVDTAVGPAIWLQIPAILLTVAAAVLALSTGRMPSSTPNFAMPHPPQPYYAPPRAPYPPPQGPPAAPHA
jgi:hypothetical protein